MNIKGIHHISAITGHPQEALDFYASFLGLKLVKQTLNYDDKNAFHLYFGSQTGLPGTLMTIFPWTDGMQGVSGGGQVTDIIFLIPKGSYAFWIDRFKAFKYEYNETVLFNEKTIQFKDRAHIVLSLVETQDDTLKGDYAFNGITVNEAIIGIHGAKIASTDVKETLSFIKDILQFSLIEESPFYYKFQTESVLGNTLYLIKNNVPRGSLGIGTVHHIAFRIANHESLSKLAQEIKSKFHVTEIKNRKYFHSIYLKEKGSNIIEFATDEPGMMVDQSIDELGKSLIIPDHYEEEKEVLEAHFMPLFVQKINEIKDYPYNNKETYESYHLHQTRLKRINELARKTTLTDAEILEQKQLRTQYVKTIRDGFKSTLDSIEFIEKGE